MLNKKTQDEKSSDTDQIIAVVIVALVSVIVAIALSIIFKDKKRRDTIKKTLTNVKEQAMEYVGDLKNKAEDKSIVVKRKFAKGKKDLKKKISKVKKNAQNA